MTSILAHFLFDFWQLTADTWVQLLTLVNERFSSRKTNVKLVIATRKVKSVTQKIFIKKLNKMSQLEQLNLWSNKQKIAYSENSVKKQN